MTGRTAALALFILTTWATSIPMARADCVLGQSEKFWSPPTGTMSAQELDVDISGNRALAGWALAYGPSAGAGRVSYFVFTENTWMATQTITAFDAAPGDGFGTSVAIDGDRSVIGSPHDDIGSLADAGSA